MTGKEALELSGRSETWLRDHFCAWCDQSLWLALTSGCGATYEKCNPAAKDFRLQANTLKSPKMKPRKIVDPSMEDDEQDI
jgi:hypothetical protein